MTAEQIQMLCKGPGFLLWDFFEHRFRRVSVLLYTITRILSAIAWLDGQLVAMGIIVHLTTGIRMGSAIVKG